MVDESQRNVFVAFTPYHLLLSCAIALSEGEQAENYLFVVGDFDASTLVSALSKLLTHAFANVELLQGTYRVSSLYKRRIIIRRNLSQIRKLLGKHPVDRVYVFNDGRAESQFALDLAKTTAKCAKGIYVEDGSAAYNSSCSSRRTALKLFLAKLVYGPWWDDVRVLGTSRWIDEVYAIFPDLVRPELVAKNVIGISRESVLELRDRGIVKECLESMGAMSEALTSIDSLVIVSHSESVNAGYPELIRNICQVMTQRGFCVAVKYHPREPLGDYCMIQSLDGVSILPGNLPVEMVYLAAHDRIRIVVGDRSTSLLTAKWLMDKPAIVSVSPVGGEPDYRLHAVFQRIGITVAHTVSDVAEQVSGIRDV